MKETFGEFAAEVKARPCHKCGADAGQECSPISVDFCPARLKAAGVSHMTVAERDLAEFPCPICKVAVGVMCISVDPRPDRNGLPLKNMHNWRTRSYREMHWKQERGPVPCDAEELTLP